ncbi:MAG TPA: hypothetical protein DEP23_00525 [Ruminococcaceae bacterium]|nr:hypothetical protein [Oscillospiraceae bacterium]
MKRYFVGSGTAIIAEFDTAEELNEWYDKQDGEERYFCRLYDTVKHIDILGSAYMWLKSEDRWMDEVPSAMTSQNYIALQNRLQWGAAVIDKDSKEYANLNKCIRIAHEKAYQTEEAAHYLQ